MKESKTGKRLKRVRQANVLRTNFIVQSNISLLTADHLIPLYQMFPDSKIAKEFACSPTKTIRNQAIAQMIKIILSRSPTMGQVTNVIKNEHILVVIEDYTQHD